MAMVRGRRGLLAVASLLSLTAMGAARGDQGQPFRALAPVEIISSGVRAPAGMAVDASDAILVADGKAGTLTRIDRSGNRRLLIDGLHRPTGVAVEADGSVLVLEHNGQRLLRLSLDGALTIAAPSLRHARAVAVGPDGRVWVVTRRAGSRGRDDKEKGRRSGDILARLDESGAVIPWASGFVDTQGIAAADGAVYVVMARLGTERGRLGTTLARVPVRADGTAGPVEPLRRGAAPRAGGVAVDAAGGVFIGDTAKKAKGHGRAGVILKRQTDGRVGLFATGLRDPVALAVSPTGDLVMVERDRPGRVLRFRAPAAPRLQAPVFTNQTPLALHGRTEAGAQITVASSARATLAFTFADATGAFALPVPLAPNATNSLSAVATGAGGAGLMGPPADADIVHDDVPPSLTVDRPAAGTHTRGPIASTAHAADEHSVVAMMLWGLDGADVARTDNPAPEQPFWATATLATSAATEGPHTLHVTASDRAGNNTTRSTSIVVDRTPPETLIVGGPAEQITARTATFTVSGTDDWSDTPDLDYAWRLDEGHWSAFDASPVVEVDGLAPGAHRFGVRARDRAGNEDPTPAERTFTIVALQIHITEPLPGTVITTTSVWVRGTVESAARDVTVAVELPAELRADLPIATLRAATEAGTFAVEIPATPSMTTLTVVATDTDGFAALAQTTIAVQPSPASGATGLEASPGAGTAPLTVRFTAPVGESARVALDLESDGTADYEGATLAEQAFAYTRPGIYVATLRVTSLDGQVAAYRAAVHVYDRSALDSRLQAAWRGFKDALRSGDVAGAVAFIHSDRRAGWEEYFLQFSPVQFAAIDSVFTDLALLEVAPDRAECEMMRDVDGLLYSFPVSLLIDVDGRWRLWQF